MKKSNKYSLLSKNEEKKEKNQEDWVEMESVSRWEGKACNNNTSYMKFEEEESEIEYGNVPTSKMSEKFTKQSSSAIDKKRMAYLQNESVSQEEGMRKLAEEKEKYQKEIYQKQQQQQNKSSALSQSQSQNINPTTTIKSQHPKNINSNSTFNNVNSQYYGQQYPNNNYYPHQSMYMSNNNSNGYRHSQMPMYSQSYYPSQQYQQQYEKLQYPQQNISTTQYPINPNRSSTRKGIPEMTVNCDKCTFTQSVPGNSQMYICCICNEINECFPLYGVFTCGICRANVIYPHGTSTLIKCTKCLTVNRVNPEPSKKVDGVVAMGKEEIELEEEEKTEIVHEEQKPFKILSVEEKPIETKHKQEEEQEEVDFFDEQNNNNDIIIKKPQQPQQPQETNELHRETSKPLNTESHPELLLPTNNKEQCNKNSKQEFDEELIELTERLDERLVLSTDEVKEEKEKEIKCEENHDHKSKKEKHQQEYPSIFI